MRFTLSLLSVVLFFILCARPSDGARPVRERPNPGDFGIRAINIVGSGCPAGTAHASVAPANDAFTVIFDDFVTQVQPGTRNAKSRCVVHVKMNVPNGWSYSLSSVDFRGFVSLEAGVNAKQKAIYKVAGENLSNADTNENNDDNAGNNTSETDWNGPFEDTFAVRDLPRTGAAQWSECGNDTSKRKNVRIITKITVRNPPPGNQAASGFLAMDSIDGEVFHVQWKRCP